MQIISRRTPIHSPRGPRGGDVPVADSLTIHALACADPVANWTADRADRKRVSGLCSSEDAGRMAVALGVEDLGVTYLSVFRCHVQGLVSPEEHRRRQLDRLASRSAESYRSETECAAARAVVFITSNAHNQPFISFGSTAVK